MNLAKIRPSFSELSPAERLELINQIRLARRTNAEAKANRAKRAACKPRAAKHEKQAIDVLSGITAEQAAKLLELMGEEI